VWFYVNTVLFHIAHIRLIYVFNKATSLLTYLLTYLDHTYGTKILSTVFFYQIWRGRVGRFGQNLADRIVHCAWTNRHHIFALSANEHNLQIGTTVYVLNPKASWAAHCNYIRHVNAHAAVVVGKKTFLCTSLNHFISKKYITSFLLYVWSCSKWTTSWLLASAVWVICYCVLWLSSRIRVFN